MKTSMTAIADVRQHRADPHALMLLVTLASCLSIGLAGCGSSILDRADEKKFFHGIIVDQEGHPVPDAEVSLRVVIPGLWGGSGGAQEATTKSDRNGIFALPGMGHPSGNLDPDVHAKAPGYVIDNFGFQRSRSEFDKNWPQGNHANPCVVRAWRLGAPSENREIDEGRTLMRKSFRIGDKAVLRAKIHLTMEEKNGSRRLLKNPTLEDASETDDWDLELSLASDSPDVGEAPFSFPGSAPLPRGMAIRVRARAGGVRQADPVFPLMARNEGFAPVVDLNWSNTVKSYNDAFYKIFYRDEALGYLSFLSIHCNYQNPENGVTLGIGFFGPANMAVSHLGVINLSGSGDLECFPAHFYNDGPEAELRRQRIRDSQEQNLDSIRKTNPKLAKEIEDRMRAEGKVVPPRK